MADFILNIVNAIGAIFEFLGDLVHAMWAAAIVFTIIVIVGGFVLMLAVEFVKRIYAELTKSR